uniref:Terpene cyclase/mutase family member n=1 Tax=Cavenderia deminutiva TaxID=361123 RepID=A0A1L2FUK6_9MYCE|nr:cycloartenol synthase [Cavenderia deminutiva]
MSWTLDVDRGRQTWRYDESPDHQIKDSDVHLLSSKEPVCIGTKYQCIVFIDLIIIIYYNLITQRVQHAHQDVISHLHDHHKSLLRSQCNTSLPFKQRMVIGPVTMVAPCSCCQDWSSHATPLDIHSLSLTKERSFVTSSTDRTLMMVDGDCKLHIEAHSDIFGTALQYVSLRLLGVPADEPHCVKARNFLKANGGALGIPSWGKFWLAVLNVYKWEGLNPIPIELWLVPYKLPLCPGRWWCHCRMVYLPMSYLYARRTTCAENQLIRDLRTELYNEAYDTIDWTLQRNNISKLDMYNPHTFLLKTVNSALYLYEKVHSKWLRSKAIDFTFDHIRYEDEQTKYIDIGPVNKTMNMLCVWDREGRSPNFYKHADRLFDYLWLGHDGMKMQGYNGSQLWDTTFAIQAFVESGISHQFPEAMRKANHYLDITQVPDNAPEMDRYFRHISKGAWPFSTVDHGWPISDCTAEGVKASLAMRSVPFITPISLERVAEGINVILSLQNGDGGWASYENTRGGRWLEGFNPSEVFHNIMIDYSYVECSAACIQAMCKFLKFAPTHPRAKEITRSIERGVQFIKSIQREDGSWIGSWGICFTYGTWFGVEGLVAAGVPLNSPHIVKACKFLISKQRPDGGWGESFKSNVTKNYVQHPDESQIVNTGWALLSLMAAKYPDREPIERGIKYLISKQYPNGDWPQESIIGVFNFNCMISYSNYKNIFPLWAIARYNNMYLKSKM